MSDGLEIYKAMIEDTMQSVKPELIEAMDNYKVFFAHVYLPMFFCPCLFAHVFLPMFFAQVFLPMFLLTRLNFEVLFFCNRVIFRVTNYNQNYNFNFNYNYKKVENFN